MNSSDRKNFSQMMRVMTTLYVKPFSEALVDIYWVSLKNFELEAIQDAFKCHMKDTKMHPFFPKPFDIVGLIEHASERRALEAWHIVEQAFSEGGPSRNPIFDDLLIHAVIEDMEGWMTFSALCSKALPLAAQAFQMVYRALVKQESTQINSYLSDSMEPEHAQEGDARPAPILFDELDKTEVLINPPEDPGVHKDHSIDHLIQAVLKVQQKQEDSDEKS